MKNTCFRFFIISGLLIWTGSAFPQSLLYFFPLDKSSCIPESSPLLIRFQDMTADDLSNSHSFITVTGSRSGTVRGVISVSDDRRTLIFRPSYPYQFGETVTVRLHPEFKSVKQVESDVIRTFTVVPEIVRRLEENTAVPAPTLQKSSPVPVNSMNEDGVTVLNGVSVPSDFPFIDISVNQAPSPGYLFCNNWNWQGRTMYSLILDHSGAPVWYWRNNQDMRDLKVQHGLLTMKTRGGYGGGGHIAMDNTYTVVDTFFAPPGYSTDEHELQLLANGHYMIIGLSYRNVNMSQLVSGGRTNAQLIENNLIEMDANDNPVFIWRSQDHYDVRDAINVDLTANSIDYIHMNSIDLDLDGNYIVSCRHLCEITKIHRETGDFIWRLGGKNDEFEWIDTPYEISWQHDTRVLPNGHLTVFDNGNTRWPRFSRALELKLNTSQMKATKVWEYRNSPDYSSSFMGNVQRLTNGNTVISWGDDYLPKITEVTPGGDKIYEMNFEQQAHCYRAFQFEWQGNAAAPYLIAEPSSDRLTLIFNKFGDPDVASYRVYGRKTSGPLQLMAETSQPYYIFDENDIDNNSIYYFRVKAVNSQGTASPYSNEEMVRINMTPAGTNMLTNGDFSSGLADWTFEVRGSAAADAEVEQGELHFDIGQPGDYIYEIQLRQEGFELRQGETYQFEFDAHADQARTIEAKVGQASGSYINYSKIGLSYVRTRTDHFTYTFVMEDPTDYYGRAVFNMGTNESDVFIDNISLIRLDTSDTPRNPVPGVPETFSLSPVYPNPFNPDTQVRFTIPEESDVVLDVVDLLGRTVVTLHREQLNAGHYSRPVRCRNLESGLYFIRMRAVAAGSGKTIQKVRKMSLIR
ncbi:aryl-sulfate sulfotransferase [bacterium]|nr:aryl-sulfate sulfotransferase [bacterium]